MSPQVNFEGALQENEHKYQRLLEDFNKETNIITCDEQLALKEIQQQEIQRKRLSAFEKIIDESSNPTERFNKDEESQITDLLKKSSYYREKEGDISLEFKEIQNEINKFGNDNDEKANVFDDDEKEENKDEEDNIKANGIVKDDTNFIARCRFFSA